MLVPPHAPATPPATTGRHARGRPISVTGAVRRTAVVDRTDIVKGLQRRCQRWLVIWSPWRQTYTGFACFTRERLVIDEPEAGRFLDRVKRIEESA